MKIRETQPKLSFGKCGFSGGGLAINKEQCEKIAQIVKKLKFRPDFLRREILTFTDDKEMKARVCFYATAICHQTRKLISEKRNLTGWDYLTKVFIELSQKEPAFFEAKNLKLMDRDKLAERLKILFSDYDDLEHTTLERAEERAEFLIEAGKILDEKYSGKVLNLLEESGGYLVKNNHGLYKLLEEFEAYSDPLKKKSGVLLNFISSSGIFEIKDPENFFPIVDYHMLRVFLRTGCLEINDKSLRRKLTNFEKIDSDEEFRSVSQKILKRISKLSGKTIIELDPIFWSLGRSCCQIKTTLCHDKVCDKNPCTFYTYINLNKHEKCAFENTCKGSLDENYRKLNEPNVETHFY
jgi:hypothetical protein